jgi:hypothetical protein
MSGQSRATPSYLLLQELLGQEIPRCFSAMKWDWKVIQDLGNDGSYAGQTQRKATTATMRAKTLLLL